MSLSGIFPVPNLKVKKDVLKYNFFQSSIFSELTGKRLCHGTEHLICYW